MTQATLKRGIQSVRASSSPLEVLAQLADKMDKFREKSEERLGTIESNMSALAVSNVAQELAGGGGTRGVNPAEAKALNNAARALLTGDQHAANQFFIEARALTSQSDPDGGYVVHDVLSSGMTKIMAEISPIYRLARRIPLLAGGAFEEVIDKDSAEAAWVGESQARPDTDSPQLGKFRVDLKEIYAMPKASQTLIDIASMDVLGWLQDKVGDAFAVKEGIAFHTGDGVAKPRGILSFPTAATPDASRAWGTFEHVATGVNGAFPTSSTSVNPADKLVDVTAALKPQYRADAVWLMNRATAAVVRKLKDADGRHVWVDSLVIGQPSVLLGYPVEIDEEMPDVATGSLSIAFGSVSRTYTIVEQPGVKFLTDPFTDKPNVRLFAYRRIGGGVNNFEGLKFLKFAA